jgi:4-hydroxybenzoate polyprenyltransferase
LPCWPLLLVLTQNALTVQLSFVGLALAVTYPFMKRFHSLPQVNLGAAFGWAIPMAYAAVTNTVPPIAWLLFLANVLWSVIYDTQYAMVDREDDRKIGVKSTAMLFGDRDKEIIGYLQLALLVLLSLVGLHSTGAAGSII